MFKKILIANRGEIAVRIIRACREMGIIAAVVFSEADRKALHVRLADEAYYIGESAPSQSYLNIDKIIAVAKKCKAQAIHPGYGFLAENPELVRRCEQEGLVFVGPPLEPLELMGRKTASRKRMTEVGVPVIPGTLEAVKDEEELI
ncbi:MAG: biotin carboxylase N-terminal domain-containing protein, partial [Candidatus Aminicenantales bacterium]